MREEILGLPTRVFAFHAGAWVVLLVALIFAILGFARGGSARKLANKVRKDLTREAVKREERLKAHTDQKVDELQKLVNKVLVERGELRKKIKDVEAFAHKRIDAANEAIEGQVKIAVRDELVGLKKKLRDGDTAIRNEMRANDRDLKRELELRMDGIQRDVNRLKDQG